MNKVAKKPQKQHQIVITQQIDYVKILLGQPPISFYKPFGELVGSAGGGLFLSQLIYWSNKGANTEGWIFKSQTDWENETCLKRGEQEFARKKCKEMGFLEEEARGIPCRLHFRIDFPKLNEALVLKYSTPADPDALPTTETGWISILPELVESAIWDQNATGQKVRAPARFAKKASDRMLKEIKETGSPTKLDIEYLESFRSHNKRISAKKAAAEEEKKKTEDKDKNTTGDKAAAAIKLKLIGDAQRAKEKSKK